MTIRVSLKTPGRLDVTLRYSIPNAGWSPAYDARLRSADRAIDLTYFGIVRNGTGEDWKNVSLKSRARYCRQRSPIHISLSSLP